MSPFAPDTRIYSEREERRIAEQLRNLTQRVLADEFRDQALDEALLRLFHSAIFGDVRGHAGRIRSPDFGQETLTFGPNRSSHRDDVPRELAHLFRSAANILHRFDANPESEQYEAQAILFAAKVHADIIKIHPFEDGNGRSCRLLLGWTLRRLGLPSVAIEAPRQEYHLCLNHYYATRDIQPLADLMLGLLADVVRPRRGDINDDA